MERIVVAAMLVLAEVSLSSCKPVHDNGHVEQAVMDAQRRWEKALKQFDPESMQSLLAEDDIQTDFRGVVNDKASWMQGFKQVAANVHSGVSKWEISFKGVRKGAPVNHVIRFTTMWVMRGGAWQLVSYQATPIEPQ